MVRKWSSIKTSMHVNAVKCLVSSGIDISLSSGVALWHTWTNTVWLVSYTVFAAVFNSYVHSHDGTRCTNNWPYQFRLWFQQVLCFSLWLHSFPAQVQAKLLTYCSHILKVTPNTLYVTVCWTDDVRQSSLYKQTHPGPIPCDFISLR